MQARTKSIKSKRQFYLSSRILHNGKELYCIVIAMLGLPCRAMRALQRWGQLSPRSRKCKISSLPRSNSREDFFGWSSRSGGNWKSWSTTRGGRPGSWSASRGGRPVLLVSSACPGQLSTVVDHKRCRPLRTLGRGEPHDPVHWSFIKLNEAPDECWVFLTIYKRLCDLT